MENLHQKTIHALSWSLVEVVAQKGVQFVIGIALARLLFPEQFGLIGMLTIFIAIIRAFLDSGFGAALIQKKDVSQADLCSIFYFNILVGLAAAGLLYLVAPWIAEFYHQPVLTRLTRALSLTVIVDSFGMIQGTILAREINFKAQTKVSLLSGLLSGIIGITLAARGFGVWSLVVQQVAASIFSTTSLWLFSCWRPALVFSFTSLRNMFGFGSRLLFSGLLNQIFENIYFVVIGRLFSATELGYFTRARTLNDFPSQTLSGMVGRVMFPVFSTLQDDPARLKRGLKKALTMLVLLNFPMMIGLAVVARPLVVVMLTDKWSPCVPYFQLLCVAGLLYPLHLINLNALQALGRSDLFLRLEIIKKAMVAINIGITWRWGIAAMIYGIIANSIIAYYLNSYYSGVLLRYQTKEQVVDFIPYLVVSMVMGVAVFAIGLLESSHMWRVLVAQVAAGAILYISLCRVLRLQAFMDIWDVSRNTIRTKEFGICRM